MTFIKKIIGLILVNKIGNIFENQKEGLVALEQGAAGYVEYQDIVIYSEFDFKDCFRHHVLGIARKGRPDDSYTVMAPADESASITEEEFKMVYEAILKNVRAQVVRKGFSMIYKIEFKFNPAKFKGYQYQNNNCSDFDDSRPVKLVCSDVKRIEFSKLQNVCKAFLLSDQEIRDIMAYYNASLLPDSDYKIRLIWVIGHSDLRSNWHN